MIRPFGGSSPVSFANVGSTSIVPHSSRQTLAWPAGERRLQVPAVPCRAFTFAQRPGTAGVVPIRNPGAVVGAEQYERLLIEIVQLQRVENLPNAPVDFGNH